jgi:hypothetical protein
LTPPFKSRLPDDLGSRDLLRDRASYSRRQARTFEEPDHQLTPPHPVGDASPGESRLKWSWSFQSNVERGGMSVLTRSDVWAGELRSVRPLVRRAWVSFRKGCESRTLENRSSLAQLEKVSGVGAPTRAAAGAPLPPSSTVSGLALDGRSYRSCAPQCRWARCLRASCGGRAKERSKGIVLITRLSSNPKL